MMDGDGNAISDGDKLRLRHAPSSKVRVVRTVDELLVELEWADGAWFHLSAEALASSNWIKVNLS